jgi:hypothetical protein
MMDRVFEKAKEANLKYHGEYSIAPSYKHPVSKSNRRHMEKLGYKQVKGDKSLALKKKQE